MIETQQTPNADASRVEAGGADAMVETTSSSGTPASDANTQDALMFLERTTGRKFNSVEEGEKFVRNLNSLVGDNAVASARQKAELADAVIQQYAHENGLTPQDAEIQLKSLVVPSKTRRTVSPSADTPSASDERHEALEREVFLMKTPEATPYIEKVSRYAKAQNIGLKEAYTELYGDVLAAKVKDEQLEAKRKDKKLASVPTSSSAPPATAIPRSKELLLAYQKNGNPDLMREAIKARQKETYQTQEE